jgi:hypothetical protein
LYASFREEVTLSSGDTVIARSTPTPRRQDEMHEQAGGGKKNKTGEGQTVDNQIQSGSFHTFLSINVISDSQNPTNGNKGFN